MRSVKEKEVTHKYRILSISKSSVVYLLVILACTLTLFPFFWMVIASLTEEKLTYQYPPTFFPLNPQFVSYIKIFLEKPLAFWMGNTLGVAVVVIALSTVVSILAGYSISRFRFAGRRIITQMILITQMIPGTLIVIPLYLMFMRFELLDTLSALILINTALVIPICVIVLKGFFDSIPVEVEEAACIDGCGTIGVLFRIVFPLSLPGFLTVVLLSFMTVWHEFLFATTLARSEATRVISVGLRYFIHEYFVDWNGIMAASVVVTIPAVIIFFVLEKWFLRGMTAGAVKG